MVFLTCHGEFVAILSIMFWNTCILFMWMFDAKFHMVEIYLQIGVMHLKLISLSDVSLIVNIVNIKVFQSCQALKNSVYLFQLS